MKKDNTALFVKKILNIFHIKLNEKLENLLIQIFKFVIVGGIATILDWIIYYVLYNNLNIPPLIASLFSFSISSIYNYMASVTWVFDVTNNKSKKRIFIEFMILCLIGLGLTELLLHIFINILLLNKMISKIISTIIVMVFNFITRKIFLEK